MGCFEDYYEPSVYDELIDKTVDKIKKSILNVAKEEVDKVLLKAEQLEKSKEQYKKFYQQSQDNNQKLMKENEELKKKLDEITSRPYPTKYSVGDKVWVIVRSNGVIRKSCPTCAGKFYIDVETKEYGTMKVSCPDCDRAMHQLDDNIKPYSKCKYFGILQTYIYTAVPSTIGEVDIATTSIKTSVEYYVDCRTPRCLPESNIFTTKEEAIKYADQLNDELTEKIEKAYAE